MTRADYETCQTGDEQAFRSAVESITLKALQTGLKAVDFKAVVAEEWRRAGLDEIIDKRVDIAVAEVREESSWGDLLQSLAYQEKSKELATAVAERVYRSEPAKAAIGELAVGVGKDVGRNIELATLDAAEPSLQCLQAFLGPRFGSTVSRVVAKDAGKEFAIDPETAKARVPATAVLIEGGEGLAGAVILLVRRQLSNLAARIGHRIVGAVLGRLVSIVAGGVGVVLIAKDIWELRSGVLPIIAEEMKSKATRDRVQEELARTISEQLDEQVREIATKAADRIVEIWREFRRAHAKVLELAERSAPFRAFLDAARPEQLARIDEVVGLVAAGEGDPGVLARLQDGTLHTAVNTLAEPGMDIARDTRSLDAALRWSAIAGDRLGLLVEHGIHKRAKADDFTKSSLARIFALDDRLAAVRLAGIDRSARDVLFELEDGDLRTLARSLAEPELGTLASYLTGLERSASQRVLRAVAQSPAKMQVLAPARVRDAVLASRDQNAAVAMMLRTGSLPNPATVGADFGLAFNGEVSPVLLWEKHAVLLVVLALLALVTLLLLKRLLFGRRRRAAA
ncbi:MAG: hypothetical protein KJZ80_01315 [Hyphomicrobiaceae bacterium]|nr:hypothetical protein [Hyphomicrobiaceae bacterium]